MPGIILLVIALDIWDCEGTLGPDVCRKLHVDDQGLVVRATAGIPDYSLHLFARFRARSG